MAVRRQQRLVSLVLLLLSSRQFISADRIRTTIEGYAGSGEAGNPDEAFKRAFERDKAELRELGVPLETGRNSIFDTEDGYRILRKDFELPPISFAPDEAAAIGLAARLWSTAPLAGPARSGLMKLQAAGLHFSDPDRADSVPQIAPSQPALSVLLSAASDRLPVRFSYQKAGMASQSRVVEPWGVLSWQGHWYLVGHDRLREAVRSFRLDRISGPVRLHGDSARAERPTGLNLLDVVRGRAPQGGTTVQLRVRDGRCSGLRRLAGAAQHAADHPGWQVLELRSSDSDRLASLIAAAGPDAVALDPPALVERVIELLGRNANQSPAAEQSETAR